MVFSSSQLSKIAAMMVLLALSTLNPVVSHRLVGACHASGYLPGKPGHCNTEHDSECCEAGKRYAQYHCSPSITDNTPATMTINSFAKGGDGGGPSECDNKYHSDNEMVVALSTGWYNGGSRCHKNIRINANGQSVLAKVVDECDSVNGCDSDHDFQPPCPYNIVDASPAVWKALGVPDSDVGDYAITYYESICTRLITCSIAPCATHDQLCIKYMKMKQMTDNSGNNPTRTQFKCPIIKFYKCQTYCHSKISRTCVYGRHCHTCKPML